jgi:hypothetical protein
MWTRSCSDGFRSHKSFARTAAQQDISEGLVQATTSVLLDSMRSVYAFGGDNYSIRSATTNDQCGNKPDPAGKHFDSSRTLKDGMD